MLITAGPTHEPIDAVRFLGNRSSGRLGVHLADAAAAHGWEVTLLLGPVALRATQKGVRTIPFRTCSDLQALLAEHASKSDVIVMAAAVADYRPKVDPNFFGGKFRRKNEPLTLTLEPTPDLIAGVSATRRPGQTIIGFALEPRDELHASAKAKLERKGLDMVVGNPLETMDSDEIEAFVLHRDGTIVHSPGTEQGRRMPKSQFVDWLITTIEPAIASIADGKGK